MGKKQRKDTPMMAQYRSIKEQHPDSILFFRLGDFYEMFEDDAIEVSRILNITLTARGGVPMAGVPYHAAKNYIKRLLDAGKKVAICEQTLTGEKLARREVVQVVTPATVIEDDFLVAHDVNFLMAVTISKGAIVTSYADLGSGTFFIRQVEHDPEYIHLLALLEEIRPRELLVNEDEYFLLEEFRETIDRTSAMVTKLAPYQFSAKQAYDRLLEHFEVATLKGFGIEDHAPYLSSAGALLFYLQETARSSLKQIDTLTLVRSDEFLQIDEDSRKSLELFANLADGSARYTLFASIDSTVTSMGTRKLKQWVASPLARKEAILARHRWVDLLHHDRKELERVRHELRQVLDLERLTSRVVMGRHLPRDITGIAQALRGFFLLFDERYRDLLTTSHTELEEALALATHIDRALDPTHQGPFEEGKVILDGYDGELDGLRKTKGGGKELLEEYLEGIRTSTGIPTIKLGCNRILGHYLEVTKVHSRKMPATFYRKQTLVNAERFTSDELFALERKIQHAVLDAEKYERALYERLVEETLAARKPLLSIASFLSDLDCYQSLAHRAHISSFVKPEFVEEDCLIVEGGRHPVVEANLPSGEFVSNPLTIGEEHQRFCLITGPNMAGKSTYLRQNAIIVLLAQIGSYVPASKATLSLVDRLYCRVGASDNLARGESTFLVEMLEAAHILRTATSRSLVIIDELGRGTSTQDGMSIAYAVMKQLIRIGSKTLFATHYHELARTDEQNLQLLTLEVLEQGREIRFLRRVIEGVANSSYGLNVAKMAGIHPAILKNAQGFQRRHFADYDRSSPQLNLFSEQEDAPSSHNELEEQVLVDLERFALEHATPVDALLFLKELQERLKAK
ncbi:MAG: DNA mismatch repair protein MutS [Spirochaetales bacterium]|nr:DNA mismatch repair protein MutS [Spirochaetales bacterium]